MKKIIFLILLCFAWKSSSAPGRAELMMLRSEKIVPFDPILYSFMKVESEFNKDTVNYLGYAGVLQIGSEMIEDVNRICKITGNPARFTLQDRFNEAKSIEIWYLMNYYYNRSYTLKRAIRLWNPTAGENYSNKIYKVFNQITKDV